MQVLNYLFYLDNIVLSVIYILNNQLLISFQSDIYWLSLFNAESIIVRLANRLGR